MEEAFHGGEHVAVEAVPGAGKTRLLVRFSAMASSSIVLAYNTQLAASTRRMLREAQSPAKCFTFHALCGRCLAPAHDDGEMLDAVERAERGEVVPHDVPTAELVLIDEAQDVRLLYVRLLRVLGLLTGTRVVVAGDRMQLIYTFDPDFPASTDTLLRPEALFGGTWKTLRMQSSRRIPRDVASFVNDMFGTGLSSSHEATSTPTVEVRVPSSWRNLYEVLKHDLTPGAFVLVDRKKNNRPLKDLINTGSRHGVLFHVHGVDTVDTSKRTKEEGKEEGKEEDLSGVVQCGTFWSAKGLECDVAIVLLPAQADGNPTYVALTRPRKKLIVVLDPRKPHAAACRAARRGMEEGTVALTGGPSAWRAIHSTEDEDAEASLTSRVRAEVAREEVVMDESTLSLERLKEVASESRSMGEEVFEPVTRVNGRVRDMSAVLLRVAVLACEFRRTGKMRRVEEVLHPTRLDYGDHVAAIRAGFVGRYVPSYVSDAALLSKDLRVQIVYPPTSTEEVMIAALATLAWDDFDHVMRRGFPLSEWVGLAEGAISRAEVLLADAEAFDTRLGGEVEGAFKTCRVDATSPTCAFHVVWSGSAAERGRASIRAGMHPMRVCRLVELETGKVTEVRSPE